MNHSKDENTEPHTMTLPVRVPWNGFPDVIVHSSIYKLKTLPEYYAAKWGNDRAAARIARTLVRPKKINTSVDFVVPVIQIEHGRYNAIPVALGAVLAKSIGAKLWLDVCQVNKVDHTSACAQDRLQNQAVFGGTAPTGKCLICDDVVTYGASLANLRGFLISAGAEVVAQLDLNPHQIDAALFAFRSPLSKAAILADEVGLGKTIEAGILLSQKWAERKRKLHWSPDGCFDRHS